MASSEEEIYSTMFTSLKHPVRRKILRMLAEKPMTFMEMVEQLEVSSSHLTYHLESLGELIFKLGNGKYKLSSFGLATVSAMKGVEEAPKAEPKNGRKLSFKWKTLFTGLTIAVLVLASLSGVLFYSLGQLSSSHDTLAAENQQLLSWGMDTHKAAEVIRNITQIDTNRYKISMLSNTMSYRTDFAATEENLKYSLSNPLSDLDIDLRFRANHLSRYELTMIESSPLFTSPQPNDVLQNAKYILNRYKTISGDAYLQEMSDLLGAVNRTQDLEVTSGNIKLQITITGITTEFLWMYTQNGVDFNAKSLRMTFQNNILTELTDGYFLFTVANTNVNIDQEEAVRIAKIYAKTLSWDFNGEKVTGFGIQEQPVSVQFVPHPRGGNSVALVPYWYVILRLDKVYVGGINEVTIGLFADTGEVVDVQMLSGTDTAT
jgi:hypothetical protein